MSAQEIVTTAAEESTPSDVEASAAEVNMREIAAEIADIMSWDLDTTLNEVEREVHAPGSHVKEAWMRANPQTPEQIETFYKTTTSYIYDLMVESAREVRLRWRTSVIEAMRQYWGNTSAARVLDYGGGVGEDSLFFAQHCGQVAYYDLPGATSDFAAQRLTRRRVPITRISHTGLYGSDFDVIVSFEVLEHVVDPASHLDELTRLTKPGGMLFLTESFDLVNENYPSHLESNRRYAHQLESLMVERGCRLLDKVEGRISFFVKGPPVSVIIPVYNAVKHTRQLLESIRSTHPGYPVRWLLANDASPDPAIAPLLLDFAAEAPDSRSVTTQTANAGFVATCNAAMRDTGADDAILLNSDTIVYDGWVRGLVEAAYESDDIGTVTPLSNNGSAYSVLKGIGADNDVNELLVTANRRLIEIPTGVGFCLYIKREAIERVGVFDPIFGRGYGEETDWCQRAIAAGYRHVLCPNVFIYHAGAASMVAAGVIILGNETLAEHAHIISERYPDFDERVQRFMASEVCDRLSTDIAQRYITMQSTRRPSIAFVTHTNLFQNAVGGTQFHLRDLIRDLGREYVYYVLFPARGGITIVGCCDEITAPVRWESDDYDALLADLNPGLVHVHHLRGFARAFADALARWRGPKLFTIHDYNGLCPTLTLINDKDQFCGVPGPQECSRCAAGLFEAGWRVVGERRATHQRLVDAADLVLAPSASALDIFRRGVAVPAQRTRVVPHAILPGTYDADDEDRANPQSADRVDRHNPTGPTTDPGAAIVMTQRQPLTVGFIGYNGAQKGGTLIPGIVAECRSSRIRCVAVGEIATAAEASGALTSTGPYRRKDVVTLIRHASIDVMVIAAPWAETYSFTLTESWLAGVPAIVGPHGAPAERVRASGAGLVLPDLRVETFIEAIRRVAEDSALLAQLKEAATAAAASLPRDYDQYRALFADVATSEPRPTQMFSGAGAQHGLIKEELMVVPLPPIITRLVQVRKLLVPVGSRRERLYFRLHNLLTPVYAGGRIR